MPDEGPWISLPPGTVQYGSRATSFHSQVSNNSQAPSLIPTTQAYLYQTSFGEYSFNRTAPFVFSLRSRHGTPLTVASFFFLNSSAALTPGSYNVSIATNKQFEVKYAVLLGVVPVGVLTLHVDFNTRVRPKFTINFLKTPAWSLGSFNVVWATIPSQGWLRTSLSSIYQNIQGFANTAMPNISSAEIGPSSDPGGWREWLTTDWKDAPAGSLQVSPVMIGSIQRAGLLVRFSANQATIDPTQVGSSTDWYGATGYPTQRKTFYYGGYYFLFWSDGSNIVYSSSNNGIAWSPAYSTGTGVPMYSFDVSTQGSTVAMAWYDTGVSAVHFQNGTITGGSISWYPSISIASVTPSSPVFPLSLAISSDGTFWLAGVWYDSSHNFNVWTYHFYFQYGLHITLNLHYPVSCSFGSTAYEETVQLLPMFRGRMMIISSGFCDTTLHWRTWGPLNSTWSQPQNLTLGFNSNMAKMILFSATTTYDGFVHLIYSPGADQIRWAYYSNATSQWTLDGVPVYSSPSSFPTISSDALGNLYAFWFQGSFFSYSSYPMYSWRPHGNAVFQGWSAPSQPFGSGAGIGASWGVSAVQAASRQMFAAWTVDPNSTATTYQVFFGSLPLASGVASAPPSQPWSRLGLPSNSPGEYVPPGNGLLTISQTDISVPGRNGLGLGIQRVYVQPFTFLQGVPFNYELSPYANLGNGWQLNLPWVSGHYLHYFNGEVFPIFWTNTTTTGSGTTWSLQYHGGEDFYFQKTSSYGITTYQLFAKDGTVYNFGGNGLLTSIVDRTGQNSIGFTYSNPLTPHLSTITDTIGRTASFTYNSPSNQLASVTYAGQTVSYGYSGNSLVTVQDSLGNILTFQYSPSNAWLITGIVYPTGGHSNYAYGNITIGTDSINNYVTLQNLYSPGTLVRSNSYSYQITDGSITYANLTQSNGVAIQGYTIYEFNSQSKSTTVTILDGNKAQMKKTRFWYDSAGRESQQDVFSGSSLSRTFYTKHFYDTWGSVIYTRDASGHESYQSFANTNTAYTFQGPGNLNTTMDGRIFYDDFNWPLLDRKSWYPLYGTATGRSASTGYSLLNLKGASSIPGVRRAAYELVNRTFSFPVYAEVQMSLGANPGNGTMEADLLLAPQANLGADPSSALQDTLRLTIASGPSYNIYKKVAGTETRIYTSPGGGSTSISWKIILTDRNTLYVFLNQGSSLKEVYSTTSLGLSFNFDPTYLYLLLANYNTANYSVSFDYLGVSASNTVVVNGLEPVQKVELVDANNVTLTSQAVSRGQTQATLNATSMVFPYGSIRIYELDGRTVQFTSPTQDVWGGSIYTYTSPFRSGGLYRMSTGFLASQTTYVDDYLPPGAIAACPAYIQNTQNWLWKSQPDFPVVSRALSHLSPVMSGEHRHCFSNGNSTYAAPGNYHTQYVYTPSTTSPSEIMLEFHDVGFLVNGGFETGFVGWNTPIGGIGITDQYSHSGYYSAFSLPDNILPNTYQSFQLVQNLQTLIPGSQISSISLWYWGGNSTVDYGYVDYDDGTHTGTNLGYKPIWSQSLLNFNPLKTIKSITVYRIAQSLTPIFLDDFASAVVGGGWAHRAYWGQDLIRVFGDGTTSRQYMGPLPAARDSWVMLTVKTDAIGTNGLYIDGISYTLYDGGVYWDFSAIGGSSTGSVTIAGLLAGQRVELYDSTGALRTSGTLAGGLTSLSLDLYGAAIGINIYPFRGFMKVYSAGGGLQYSSPLMTDIWGGDTYTYNQPVFSNSFTFGQLNSAVHGALVGQVQYQSGTSIPEESYYTYDSVADLKQSISLHEGLPFPTTYTYDVYGNRVSSINANNQLTNYTYLPVYGSAYLTNVTRSSAPGVNLVNSYRYDGAGNIIEIVDPTGNVTDYRYDLIGRKTAVLYSSVGGTRAEVDTFYDDRDGLVDVRTERGNYTRTIYDGLARRLNVLRYSGTPTTPLLSNETYTYNWQGLVRSYRAPDGSLTTYAYDYLGRLTSTTNPDTTMRTITYDDVNLIQSKYDENVHRIDYVYDVLQRLIAVKQYTSPTSYYTTAYSYDSLGNLLQTVDAKSQTTAYSYDDMNRLSQVTYPDTLSQYESYDNVGNLQSLVDPDQHTKTFTYDNLNRPTKISYSADGTQATFSYDKNGNRIAMSNQNSTATFRYDAQNRLISESWTILGSSYTLSYSYDAAGNLVGMTYPDGTLVKYSIDALNRISSITQGQTTLASFAYGTNMKASRITYGNGVQTSYSYDSRSRPTRIKIVQSSTLLDLNYTYDATSNVIGIRNGAGLESYSFDWLNRLTYSSGSWPILQYGYDAVGNRQWMSSGATNTTYTYGSFNRMTAAGPVTYTYDNDGNQISQRSGSTTTSFTYNFEKQLTKVSRSSSSLGVYAYSTTGMKIIAVESGTTTVGLNQGVNVVYEKNTGGSTIVNEYVFAGSLLVAKLSSGSVLYYHQDHLGNTRLVTTGSTSSFSSNYQPYGLQYGASGTDPVYKYTEKPQSPATGLYYYGARWYNSTLGRFLTRDPNPGRLSNPQSLNLYIYVGNNPLRYTDPTGMDGCAWWDVACNGNNAMTAAGNWWNSQDQTTRLAIIAVVATVVIVATAGIAAPALLPLIATGIAIGAGSSVAAYTATTLASGGSLSLKGFLTSAAIGGFFGAVSFGTYGVVAGAAYGAGFSAASSFLIGVGASLAASKAVGTVLGTSDTTAGPPDLSSEIGNLMTGFQANSSPNCRQATGPGGIVTTLLVGGALVAHLSGYVHIAASDADSETGETVAWAGFGAGLAMIGAGIAIGYSACNG